MPAGVRPSPSRLSAAKPLTPTKAGVGPTTVRQPPPSRSKAWSVALLLPHDVDVTVMTWVAPPSPCRRSTSRGAGTAGAEAGRGVGVRLAVVVSGGGAGRAAAGRGTVVGGGNVVAGA